MSWTQLGVTAIKEFFSWLAKPSQPKKEEATAHPRDIAIASESHMAASREGKIAAANAKKKKP